MAPVEVAHRSADADLGGGVFKQRVARKGEGKSGGLRTIIFKAGGHTFFVRCACLTPVEPMKPAEIGALRQRENVSQPVFAHCLNVKKDAVSKWKRGEKRPDGPWFKLLHLEKAKGLKSIEGRV